MYIHQVILLIKPSTQLEQQEKNSANGKKKVFFESIKASFSFTGEFKKFILA